MIVNSKQAMQRDFVYTVHRIQTDMSGKYFASRLAENK